MNWKFWQKTPEVINPNLTVRIEDVSASIRLKNRLEEEKKNRLSRERLERQANEFEPMREMLEKFRETYTGRFDGKKPVVEVQNNEGHVYIRDDQRYKFWVNYADKYCYEFEKLEEHSLSKGIDAKPTLMWSTEWYPSDIFTKDINEFVKSFMEDIIDEED